MASDQIRRTAHWLSGTQRRERRQSRSAGGVAGYATPSVTRQSNRGSDGDRSQGDAETSDGRIGRSRAGREISGGAIGDPLSQFSNWKSDGLGGPGGIGNGCCNGIGDSVGPGVGNGPPGIFPAGKHGVTVPQAIYSPEPSFSDEARKAKAQGIVSLVLVVGRDGLPAVLKSSG